MITSLLSATGPVSWRALPRIRAGWLLVAVILLGALVRFATLGEQSFWVDEAYTRIVLAKGGPGHVLSTIPGTDLTPPFYYMLAWFWSRCFGLGEVGLRSFSALCGALTIPVMWMLGRRLVSARVGLVAALLTAINPLLFWYSQEARCYALVVLLSGLSLLALLRALERMSKARLGVWGVVCALALCTHYFAAFLIAAEGLWLLFALRRDHVLSVSLLLIGYGPIVAMAASLVPLLREQVSGQGSHARTTYILHQAGSLSYRLGALVKQDIVGFGQPLKLLLGLAGTLLALLGLVILARSATHRERSRALLPLLIGLGSLLLALLIAGLPADYFNTRNALPMWPAFALVVAIGYGSARAGHSGTAGLTGIVVVSLFCIANVTLDARYQRDDWRDAAGALGSARMPRAIIGDSYGRIALQPYLRGLLQFPVSGMEVQEVDVISVTRPVLDAPVPAPRPASAPPGFELVERTATPAYVVLRYRASSPKFELLSSFSPDASAILQLPSRRGA